MISVATLLAIFFHVWHYTGLAQSYFETFWDFLKGSVTSPETYILFVVYIAGFLVIVGSLFTVLKRMGSRRGCSLIAFLGFTYSASAVNIAVDYSWRRPLFRVSGDPDAGAFFFAAGLFGVEFSLILHILIGSLNAWRCFRVS